MDQYYSIYGALALTHLGLQMFLAHKEHKKQTNLDDLCTVMSVGIVIPVYNEDPQVLKQCVYSALATHCSKKSVIVIDDGSTNIEALSEVYKEVEQAGAIIIRLPENVGKRNAQKAAFDKVDSLADIIITIDSDTMIAEDGIQEILTPFLDQKVGAVTGHVMVANENTNILTKMISCRYWNAFNQERAAQSLVGAVTCCSGPFSAYRSSIIWTVKEDYINQKFLGENCTYGDDRHLTNLVLKLGYKVKYQESAKSYTHVPETIQKYLKQQVRWGRSFFREMLWTFKALSSHHPYMTYDIAMQILLPFLLIIALGGALFQSTSNPMVLVHYLAVVVGISFLRSMYGLKRTKKPIFYAFCFYGLLYILFLVPLKVYALSTMTTKSWGTR